VLIPNKVLHIGFLPFSCIIMILLCIYYNYAMMHPILRTRYSIVTGQSFELFAVIFNL